MYTFGKYFKILATMYQNIDTFFLFFFFKEYKLREIYAEYSV